MGCSVKTRTAAIRLFLYYSPFNIQLFRFSRLVSMFK
jgi:hypothetical protein